MQRAQPSTALGAIPVGGRLFACQPTLPGRRHAAAPRCGGQWAVVGGLVAGSPAAMAARWNRNGMMIDALST